MFKLVCFSAVCLNWGAISSMPNTDDKPCKVQMVGGHEVVIEDYSCKQAIHDFDMMGAEKKMMQNLMNAR